MRERPVSIQIFAILNIIFALLGFFGVLVGAALKSAAAANPTLAAINSDPTMAAWGHVQAAFDVVGGLALLVSGIGLWKMKNWARILSLVYAGIAILFTVIGTIVSWKVVTTGLIHTPSHTSPEMMQLFTTIGLVFGTIFKLAYPVLMFIFLTPLKIRNAFAPPAPAAPPPPL